MKHLHLALVVALVLAGCGTPAAGPLGAKLTIAPAITRPALVAVPAPASRVLAEGAFTLPASLVSIGSGGLVSIGSGGLVSIGSGGLVSIGSGGYKVLAADAAADVAVPGALVALARPYGEALDASWEVDPAQTGADGGYRLHGRAPAGLYRVAATASGHTFFTLAAITTDAPARAAVDAATTMVAAKLLAEHPAGDLSVLPMQAFGASVAAVRAAIAAEGLPAGWTPEGAAAAMAALERRNPGVAGAMQDLRDRQAGLERREDAFGYRLQELAATLGVPSHVVEEEYRAALSAAPEATDAELDAEVSNAVRRRTEADAAPTPAPSAAATPAGEAPTAGEAPAPAPSADAEEAPAAEPPKATPAEGATKDDAAIERAMAKEERKAQKKNEAAQTPEPTPTPADEDEAPAEEPPTEGEGDGGTTEEPGNGNAGGNGNGNNAGGNGAENGNGDNAGGNGNANGQNGTQGQGNGGTNNGNGGATNGTGNT